MQLLLLTSEFPPQPGGIGMHAYQVASGFSDAGYRVTVVTDQRSEKGVEERDFDAKQAFRVVRIPRRKLIFMSYANRILQALRYAKNADVVIASGKFSLWQASWIRPLVKAKFIGILHGSELNLRKKYQRKWTDNALLKMDQLIAVSHFTKSLTAHLNLKHIHVIPNGFQFLSQAVPTERNLRKPPDKVGKLTAPRLITVGNLTQRKGQHNVIRALPLLLQAFPDLTYHLVGIPTEQERLQKLATQLGVAHAVVIHGRVDEAQKMTLLHESDVFVMLSEKTPSGDVEGFGIAIIEANALGVPAIGAVGCGIEDAIKDRYSGRLIDAHNPQAVADALQDILQNYDDYAAHAQRWSSRFTVDKMIQHYLQVTQS